MDAIYDRDGKTVAWRRRDVVFDTAGTPVGLIHDRCLHDTRGRYLGRFEDGWYRDAAGKAVGCEANATGGPVPPLPERGAIEPPHGLRPPEPVFEQAPRAPMRLLSWSPLDFGALTAGAGREAARH
jgi:hypothetical protein